jgi:hypothetical protein
LGIKTSRAGQGAALGPDDKTTAGTVDPAERFVVMEL